MRRTCDVREVREEKVTGIEPASMRIIFLPSFFDGYEGGGEEPNSLFVCLWRRVRRELLKKEKSRTAQVGIEPTSMRMIYFTHPFYLIFERGTRQ